MIGALASVAGNLFSSIGKMVAGRQQTKRNMADLNGMGQYQTNPYAEQGLALAQNLYNGRSAGAVNAEQNILTNQANTMAGVERNATDASQALAVGAAVDGQSNNAFANLAQQESMDRMQKAGMVTQAQQGMINEGDKVWQDKMRYLKYKMGIRSVGTQNTLDAMTDLGKTASMFGNMWEHGDFKKK